MFGHGTSNRENFMIAGAVISRTGTSCFLGDVPCLIFGAGFTEVLPVLGINDFL